MPTYFYDHNIEHLLTPSLEKQRAFLYGDAHFTTAKVVNGQICYFTRHINRLKRTSTALGFNPINWSRLETRLMALIAQLDFGFIKVQISRGESVRGYGNANLCEPLMIVSFQELNQASFNEIKSIELGIAETKLAVQPQLAGLKHCNRLEQVLIAQEIEKMDYDDVLVANIEGDLIETNKANVFWMEQGLWYTPSLDRSGVQGIMREKILDQAPQIVITNKPANSA